MKKIILTAFLLYGLQGVASAQQMAISSGAYAGVSVSTYTPTRMDNILIGGGEGIINSRAEIKVHNYRDNLYSLYCGFDVNVSTDIDSVYAGEEIAPGMSIVVTLGSKMAYYCLVDGAVSIRVHVQQGADRQGKP